MNMRSKFALIWAVALLVASSDYSWAQVLFWAPFLQSSTFQVPPPSVQVPVSTTVQLPPSAIEVQPIMNPIQSATLSDVVALNAPAISAATAALSGRDGSTDFNVVLAGAGDAIFATDPNTGEIYSYNRGSFAWIKVGGPGREFAANNRTIYGVSPTDFGIYEFSGSPGTWTRVGETPLSIIAGGDRLYAINPWSWGISRYENQPYVWTNIGGPGLGSQFAANNKTIYGLSGDLSTVYEFDQVSMQWTAVGGPATSIIAGGDNLYGIKPDTGDVYRYENQPFVWTQVGGPGSQFVANDNTLYGLSPDYSGVYAFTGTPMNWSQVGGPAASIIANGTGLYMIHPDTGNIWRYDGAPSEWTELSIPPQPVVHTVQSRIAGSQYMHLDRPDSGDGASAYNGVLFVTHNPGCGIVGNDGLDRYFDLAGKSLPAGCNVEAIELAQFWPTQRGYDSPWSWLDDAGSYNTAEQDSGYGIRWHNACTGAYGGKNLIYIISFIISRPSNVDLGEPEFDTVNASIASLVTPPAGYQWNQAAPPSPQNATSTPTQPLMDFWFEVTCPSDITPCFGFYVSATSYDAAYNSLKAAYSNCDVQQIDYDNYVRLNQPGHDCP